VRDIQQCVDISPVEGFHMAVDGGYQNEPTYHLPQKFIPSRAAILENGDYRKPLPPLKVFSKLCERKLPELNLVSTPPPPVLEQEFRTKSFLGRMVYLNVQQT
jgi:hypothetical protein